MRKLICLVCLSTILAIFAVPVKAEPPWSAHPLPDLVIWPRLSLQGVAGGFTSPVQITHAGDGSRRIFVVEQNGLISILKNGIRLPTPFLDISGQVSCCGERGLLGVAFSPDFSNSGYFYVNYTDTVGGGDPNGDTVIARYQASANPDVADPNSGVQVLSVAQPYANHNGGQLAFGPDGYLYIGMGDGGGTGDPEQRAQNPAELLGKLLRIDVQGAGCVTNPPGNPNYCVPPSNPFVGAVGYRPEVWAMGLRNPWRFSFDRLTGDLYMADVGQSAWEEVNFQPVGSTGGENYGWDILEGTHCFEPALGCTPPPGYAPPVIEYGHTGGRCSVTGGGVYRGSADPISYGLYFFADFCTGEIFALSQEGGWQTQMLLDSPFTITTFGEDQDGSLYTADYGAGIIYRMISTGSWTSLYFPLIQQD